MTVVNLIWGFTLGAGIDKCYLTYARLGEVEPGLRMVNVCIDIASLNSHTQPLRELGVRFVRIANQRDVAWVWRLRRLLREVKPDVVFTHGFNGAIMMMVQRALGCRARLVCSYHGLYHAPTAAKRALEPLYNGLPRLIYRHMAHRVVCVEQFSRRYLIGKGVPEGKVVTVHNGLPPAQPAEPMTLPGLRDGEVAVLTASRVSAVKGLTHLLDALALLRSRGLAFRYYMVGEGPELGALADKARTLGLADCVEFVGYRDDVPRWMASCHVFALPSLHEYHSIALLEAMRAGCAVVATDVGGNAESVVQGESGLLVPPADAQALADALSRVISDEALRHRLGDNARRRFADNFTEEAMMRRLAKCIMER